jgi:hypothetical protein
MEWWSGGVVDATTANADLLSAICYLSLPRSGLVDAPECNRPLTYLQLRVSMYYALRSMADLPDVASGAPEI